MFVELYKLHNHHIAVFCSTVVPLNKRSRKYSRDRRGLRFSRATGKKIPANTTYCKKEFKSGLNICDFVKIIFAKLNVNTFQVLDILSVLNLTPGKCWKKILLTVSKP